MKIVKHEITILQIDNGSRSTMEMKKMNTEWYIVALVRLEKASVKRTSIRSWRKKQKTMSSPTKTIIIFIVCPIRHVPQDKRLLLLRRCWQRTSNWAQCDRTNTINKDNGRKEKHIRSQPLATFSSHSNWLCLLHIGSVAIIALLLACECVYWLQPQQLMQIIATTQSIRRRSNDQE